MKRVKMWLGLLCALALTVSALAACGNDETDGSSNDSGNNSNVQDTAQNNEQPGNTDPGDTDPGDAEPVDEHEIIPGQYDFGGRVFKIGAWWDISPKEGVDEQTDAYIQRIKDVEEAWNCTIEFVVVNDTNTTYVTSTLAGEPVADIVRVLSYDVLPGYIEGGLVYPLSDLEAFDFNDYKWLGGVTNLGTYEGKVYAMDIKSSMDNSVRFGVFYNRTLFEEYNLEDPAELVDSGEWTWEKFLEIAKMVTTDTDGDGVDDVAAISGEWPMYNLIASNGADIVARTDTAAVVKNLNDPKVIEAMEFGARLNSEITFGGGDADTEFRNGNVAMAILEWWHVGNFYTKDGIRQMEDNWGFVPFPKGPSADTYHSYGKEISPYVMLATTQNPEDVAIVFNAITDFAESDDQWDEWLTTAIEVQADDYATVTHVVDMINDNITMINPLQGFTDIFNLVNVMLDEVWQGVSTPQVALESYESAIASAVEDAQNRDYNAQYEEIVRQAELSTWKEPEVDGTVIDTSAWTIEAYQTNGGDDVAFMIDADGATRWANGEAQLPGTMDQWVLVDMGSVQEINRVTMWTPGGDCAKGYEIYVSEDGNDWTMVASGVAVEYFTDVDFDTVSARYFRINQTGDGPTNYWSINELRAYRLN